ncbi:LysR family transcriptional regulator [Marinimicrobium agarilyticum]|uniref:LysR family transcriptional regulator n=1 Tax=Marinimicrobium agarilyticum TaxID=306546 RepID=UPI00040CF2FC|nr:LysR family transcriptional regulator [Marinimicrobium agarilyticum]
MTDRRLQIFYTVARTGNITRAAHILNMTQPAVSSQIQRFEHYYGVQLLHRHTDGVSLTDIGNEVYYYASSICVLQEAMDRRLKTFRDGDYPAALRLAATPGASDFLMHILVKGFCAEHLDVNVEVNVEDYERIIHLLGTRRLDLGLLESTLHRSSEYTIERSWQDPLVVFVAEDHPLSQSSTVSVEELLPFPLICRDEGDYLHDQLLGHSHWNHPAAPHLRIRSNFGSLDAVIDAVRLNMGIAVLPMTAVQRMAKASGCKQLDLTPGCSQTLSLVRHPSRPEQGLVGDLLTFASDVHSLSGAYNPMTTTD